MTPEQRDAVHRHGLHLLQIFPGAQPADPVGLCKKLRRLEGKAYAVALRACNGPNYDDETEEDRDIGEILASVRSVLDPARGIPIFLNRDARGYALKICSEWMDSHPEHRLHRDWGGYGVLAPEIDAAGN